MNDTMRAIVLDAPGPPSALIERRLPIPEPKPGQVLIKVSAFGLNRSELHLRLGLAENATFPRVPGIEATGVVAAAPGGEFAEGQPVMTMMGGMGRAFDGGYAEYTLVPAGQVIPFRSDREPAELGAIPETLQTAYGSLTVGLDARRGQSVLIRGGTSSVGLTAAVLAKHWGLTVLATTRDPAKKSALEHVDHVLIDDGNVADQVRQIFPDGVDGAIELVGTPTLPDTLRAVRVHGTVCFSGLLSDQWIVPEFYPIGYLPAGVRLTGYGGEAANLPAKALQEFLDAGLRVPVAKVYPMDRIAEAHDDMEHNRVAGKLVVTV